MRVKCIANTGAGFSPYTLEHMGCSLQTQLPLNVNDLYVVYGQMIWRGMLQYLIKGGRENLPSWYPAEIFEVVQPQVYYDWYFRYTATEERSALWGFQELVTCEEYIDSLIERESNAVRVFLSRKAEMDEAEREIEHLKGQGDGSFV